MEFGAHTMWDVPRSGIEPVFLALSGGFFTMEPPGGSPHSSLDSLHSYI